MPAYKVTVAMPAHNVETFIEKAVESVLYQNYENFELVIVDDASTDKTPQILKKYQNLPNVRILTNKNRLGRGASRNLITKIAKGRYLSPCDADDIMLQGNLKTFSRYLDRHPDIGVVYGDIQIVRINKKGKPIGRPVIHHNDCNHVWDLLGNTINHPGSMMRKSTVIKIGGYDEKVTYVDDWSLWLKMAEVTRFKYLPGKVYYVWHRHANSKKKFSRKDREDMLRIRREAIKRRYGKNLKFKIS